MRLHARLIPFATAAAFLLGASTSLAEPVQVSDSARQHFQTGVAYLQDPDGARYEEAYREFRAAYDDSPSWKILGNLGITAMKLERDGEAVWAFETYLKEGGEEVDPTERAQMERDLQTTRAGLVWADLTSVPPGARLVDERIPLSGRPVVNRYAGSEGPLKIGMRRGRHRITASLDGYEDATWEADLQPGQDQAHEFVMQMPAPAATTTPAQQLPDATPSETLPTERPIPLPVYITAGATGAFLVGGIVVGALAAGKKSDFNEANDGTNPQRAQDLRDSGTTLNVVADVLYGGAIVAGAVTAVLYIGRPEVPVQADHASLRVQPQVGPSGGSLSLAGTF